MNDDIEELISEIRARFSRIGNQSDKRQRFLLHLQSLGCWEEERREEYPEVVASFPDELEVAYASCRRQCSIEQLIVEGSTQECQRCGSNMFRVATKKYRLSESAD